MQNFRNYNVNLSDKNVIHGVFANIFKMLSSKRPNIVTSTEYCPDLWTKLKKTIGIGNV